MMYAVDKALDSQALGPRIEISAIACTRVMLWPCHISKLFFFPESLGLLHEDT